MKPPARLILLLLLGFTFSVNAHAWFWAALRAGTTRGAVTAGARVAGAEVATGASTARNAAAATRAAGGSGHAIRYCVRPKNAPQCDFHNETSAYDAAAKAVGSNYRVRPTGEVGIFQVIDAVGTIVDIIEAVSEEMNASTARLPQYNGNQAGGDYKNRDASSSSAGYGGPRIPDAPQSMQQPKPAERGEIWQYDLNYASYEVWSDGDVVVWTENSERRYALGPYQTITVTGRRFLYVSPQTKDATRMTLNPAMTAEIRQPVDSSRPNGVFPYGSNVSCPQVPIGNGMARCQ